MWRIRAFEERVGQLTRANEVHGLVHLSTGQEAVAVGVCSQQLPAILVCENNGFAEYTPRSAHTTVERVSDVVAPYGIERETVDGNDVLAVHEAFGRFLAAARAGGGPALLECLTHRLGGHYEGDPQHYRERLADEKWRELDPILRLERKLGAESFEAEARAEVEEAVEFARVSAYPPPELMEHVVYA